MTIAVIIAFLLIGIPVVYLYSKMDYYRRASYEPEITAKLEKEGRELLEIREPNPQDWINSPFSKFEFTIGPYTGGSSTTQTFYRIIKYQDKRQRKHKYAKGPEEAWVKIETSPFLPLELIIKKRKNQT